MSKAHNINWFLVFIVIALISEPCAVSGSSIQVGENIQVSKDKPNETHYEVLIAASSKNPMNLLGGSMVFSAELNDYFLSGYGSTDGGKTWFSALDVKGFDAYACDPTVAFGPEGDAYFAGIGYIKESEENAAVFRTNQVLTEWFPPIKLSLGVDREYLTVDNTNSKYRGRVYLHGAIGTKFIDGKSGTGITVVRSEDSGITFSSPTSIISSGTRYLVPMGNGAILSDGTFVIVFGEVPGYWRENGSGIPPATPKNPNAELKIVASEDGGVTFSKAIKVTDWYLVHDSWNTTAIPYIAVDQSAGPYRDRLYLVWTDKRLNKSRIHFSYSSDKGKTWSEPAIISNNPTIDSKPKFDDFMPVVAVNTNGVVGILWYDRSESPDNLDWWVRFTASLDGGDSFMPSVKVSSAPFSHKLGEKVSIWGHSTGGGSVVDWDRGGPFQVNLGVHSFYFNGGHTAGLASADESFHPFWIDNRTGIPQIWTAKINVNGKAVPNGMEELSTLQDITEKVGLVLTETKYDPESKIVYANAHLVNTSNEAISGPLKLRIVSIESAFGTPQFLSPDGKDVGNEILNFTPLLSSNELKPKESSGKMPLKFRLSNITKFEAGADYLIRFVSLKARAYGTLSNSSNSQTKP